MRFEKPTISDFGSVAAHTFTNIGQVKGRGPQGKDKNAIDCHLDKFDEPSCNGGGLS